MVHPSALPSEERLHRTCSRSLAAFLGSLVGVPTRSFGRFRTCTFDAAWNDGARGFGVAESVVRTWRWRNVVRVGRGRERARDDGTRCASTRVGLGRSDPQARRDVRGHPRARRLGFRRGVLRHRCGWMRRCAASRALEPRGVRRRRGGRRRGRPLRRARRRGCGLGEAHPFDPTDLPPRRFAIRRASHPRGRATREGVPHVRRPRGTRPWDHVRARAVRHRVRVLHVGNERQAESSACVSRVGALPSDAEASHDGLGRARARPPRAPTGARGRTFSAARVPVVQLPRARLLGTFRRAHVPRSHGRALRDAPLLGPADAGRLPTRRWKRHGARQDGAGRRRTAGRVQEKSGKRHVPERRDFHRVRRHGSLLHRRRGRKRRELRSDLRHVGDLVRATRLLGHKTRRMVRM
mmetsp:Transcript_4467/g.28440  ORF Transcript_4467/g.28440 Transcript_4467/m.28440 type:complete len:409 (+) Transcript_4467:1271-2497(+)